MTYLYGVLIRRTSPPLPILPCTLYSCQVTSSPLPDDGERTRLTRAAVVDQALATDAPNAPDGLAVP